MTSSDRQFLIEILETSTTINERRSTSFAPRQEEHSKADANDQLTRWASIAPRGKEDFFVRRLTWDGLGPESALKLLGSVQWLEEKFPFWLELLHDLLEHARGYNEKAVTSPSYLDPDRPLPFEHVFLPFVSKAASLLQARLPADGNLLTTAAWAALERSLLTKLSAQCEKVLSVDFATWKALQANHAGLFREGSAYSAYIDAMWHGELRQLFRTYPMLARFVGRTVEHWIDATQELLCRLHEDRDDIARTLFHLPALGQVTRLKLDLSDSHRGGRSVCEVFFGDAGSCFYKPRNCKAEQALNDLLRWFNGSPEPTSFKTYRVLSRDTHGWVEKVDASECKTQEEVQEYFREAGMLIAVLYALEASDCNGDNLIAAGAHPVLIDAETLVQPRPAQDGTDSWKALTAVREHLFYDSVLRLHILPSWTVKTNGERMDISGLGSNRVDQGTAREKQWSNLNTDDMVERWQVVPARPRRSGAALFSGAAVNSADFVAQILDGFEAMYLRLINERAALSVEHGPLAAFGALTTRIIVRNTYFYHLLRKRLLEPRHLRSGVDAYIAIDSLSKAFQNASSRPLAWPFVGDEHLSLIELDIPYFTCSGNDSALVLSDQTGIAGYFRESPSSVLNKRFSSMSTIDLDLQKRYIRSSFEQTRVEEVIFEKRVIDEAEIVLTSGQFLKEAERLAETISHAAICTPDNTAGWVAQSYNPDAQVSQLHPIGLFLYDGLAGIAVFLAALRSLTGRGDHDALLEATLNSLLQTGTSQSRHDIESDSVGAGLGIPSIAYSLARVAVFSQNDRLLHQACELLERVTPSMIEQDRRLDLIGGTAGCLLVLDALNKIQPHARFTELAIACGNHLLRNQSKAADTYGAWKTIRGLYLTGMSHGAAGISYALARLYEWTGERQFCIASRDGMRYETQLFDKAEHNWPNLLVGRKEGGYGFWNSWCHGAPGIGLARLGSASVPSEGQGERDWLCAIEKAGSLEINKLDNACCGNFGRIDVLIESAKVRQRNDCLLSAIRIGSAAVRRATDQGLYGAGSSTGIMIASFHQGLAGLGYQLLRLSSAGELPSILSWQ